MKHFNRFNQLFAAFAMSLFLLFTACGDDGETEETTTEEATEDYSDYSYSNNTDKGEISYEPGPMPAYKSTELFKGLYEYSSPVPPPKMDLSMDLKGKTMEELRFLRYEVIGRNGFMFIDDVLRRRFANEPWYQPIYYSEEPWEVTLTGEEQVFVDRVQKAEESLQKNNYIQSGGQTLVNTDNIVNRFTFDPKLLEGIDPYLEKNAFAIVPAKHEQLFHLYDQNDYQGIPPFITSDLYLQVFHIYFSYLLRDLEEDKFVGILEGLIQSMYTANQKLANSTTDESLKAAAEYNMMYYGLAFEVLSSKKLEVPEAYQEGYRSELAKVNDATGQGSEFLKSLAFDYSLFKPRGHYTRSDALTRYFKTMMWLQTAPANRDNEVGLHAMYLSAVQLYREKNAQGKSLMEIYNSLFEPIMFIVGEPNQLGPKDVIDVMKAKNMVIEDLTVLEGDNPETIYNGLKTVNLKGFKKRGANKETQEELDKLTVFFMPQRYTFDAEVLNRLSMVERLNLNEPPMRPVPKGLDIFAALRTPEAERILMEVYKEGENWPAYPDTLKAVQEKFQAFHDWDKNMYNKWMQGLKKLSAQHPKYPHYMKTQGWDLKNLQTALASWTELKHDVILYADQPVAAEYGDGGEWPDPVLRGAVEPNITFWENSMELCNLTEKVFSKFNLLDKNLSQKNKSLHDLANRMATYSRMQLNGDPLSSEQYDDLRYIGGEMEQLTLRVMDSEVYEWYEIEGPDKFVAVVTDVFSYQGQDKKVALTEAVGYGDEIYVVVEFDGYLYLARGATLSYFEFEQPINERLTDEEWQKQVKEGSAPARPEWTQEIIWGDGASLGE